MQTQVFFNFSQKILDSKINHLQNFENVKIVIEYLEEDQNNQQFIELIQKIKDVKNLEIVIEELDLFSNLKVSEYNKMLLNYLVGLKNLQRLLLVVKLDNTDNSKYVELNNFFFENSGLQLFSNQLEYTQ
ncbi:hypothetical protein TTHERM_00188680 (macronuclear) [Tetrahymena thermophila SB210]|uniref:Uncharacterized protein n=1 Tax=Tetrahymena thermophila (strain SB210) TaxID=312017 RepID=I7M1G4_TETTS|nr:hypothetical protein TTHERM_00188680 [Tetrahymena thermophila SB210]EAR96299.1 hypothetical protein TTHERM_00188680 [Tetrahymena thermophila SB210]|eukprot:XP_001016544.1 hypothetical protein TTHERM_00188680 [Tetrahymena thermophila SB210]